MGAGGESRDDARRPGRDAIRQPRSKSSEITRDMVRSPACSHTFAQDIRSRPAPAAARSALRAFAIASLALGIGATGAIFSLFDGIALRRAPVL